MALSRFQNQQLVNETELDNVLLQLSRNLVPAYKDLYDAKNVADDIIRTLQKNRKFEIERLGIMGSVEKKTALASEFDLDCVIFVNNITIKDFPTVLHYFEQTLELEDSISDVAFGVPKTKGVALQVTVDEFEFDIAPAIIFSEDRTKQRDKVLAEIRKLPHPSKDGYRLSSSLIFENVNFIKKQSAFAHDIIRLAKLWNRSVFIEDYISGRSTMIELIAVDAANKVEESYCESHVEAFRQFLHSMRDLKNVVITFDHRGIDSYISSQRPLVLDPVNPYNNFAYDLKRKNDVRLQLEKFANFTLQSLNAGNVFTLFRLQMNTELSVRVSRKWILEVDDNDYESKRIRVIERNYEENHLAAKIYKHFFSSDMKILKSDGKTKKQLQDDVQKSIDEFERNNREWEPTDGRHEDRDVTFDIPSGDGRFFILCSCNL